MNVSIYRNGGKKRVYDPPPPKDAPAPAPAPAPAKKDPVKDALEEKVEKGKAARAKGKGKATPDETAAQRLKRLRGK